MIPPCITLDSDNSIYTNWFSIRKYGEQGAFERAVEARRQLLSKVEGAFAYHPEARRLPAPEWIAGDELVRQPTGRKRMPNPCSTRTRDILGVHLNHVETTRKDGTVTVTPYWSAVIEKQKGRPVRRYFSVLRYGEQEAKRLAIAQRRAWEAPKSARRAQG